MLTGKKIILIFVFQLIICISAYGEEGKVGILWQQFQTEQNKDKKLDILFNIGDKYFLENSTEKRDSVFQLALELGYTQQNADNARTMSIYKWYFDKEYTWQTKNAADYAARMEKIALNNNNNEWLFHAYFILYNINYFKGNWNVASDYINKAYYCASITDNESLKAESLLALGKCKQRSNNIIDALRNYMDALYIASKTNNDTILYKVYGELSSFFRINANYEKAKEYKQKQFSMLLEQQPIDSTKLMWLYDELANILFDNKERKQAEKIIQIEMNYAYRNHFDELKNSALTIYRTFLLENNYLKDLVDLYSVKYPGELVITRIQYPLLYLRLMGYVKEVYGQKDSADSYYRQAEKLMIGDAQNPVQLSNFYRRYGQFLLRNNNPSAAEINFEKSLEYARTAVYLPYMIEATGYIDSINSSQKNYSKAYHYAKLNILYKEQLSVATKKEDQLQLEINNEINQRTLAAQRAQVQMERRHSIQYIAITIFIAFTFIILAMIGSFKVPKLWIKFIGFFSFILLFEFIVMVTDTKVEAYTHGEPYKILGFKIIIILCLTPVHHWLEHKVLEYLYDHQLIDPSKLSVKHIFSGIKKKNKVEVPKAK